MLWSRLMTPVPVTLWPLINLLTWPTKNSEAPILATSPFQERRTIRVLKNWAPTHHHRLTGLPLVMFPPSRTKVNVDHAGPSPQPAHWNHVTPFSALVSETFLNNNSLIAPPAMETTDATEVWWTMLSTTLLPTVSPPNRPTHTQEFREPARSMAVPSRSLHTLMFQLTIATCYRLLLPNNPHQLLSMPKPGNSTALVSSPSVENLLTMES